MHFRDPGRWIYKIGVWLWCLCVIGVFGSVVAMLVTRTPPADLDSMPAWGDWLTIGIVVVGGLVVLVRIIQLSRIEIGDDQVTVVNPLRTTWVKRSDIRGVVIPSPRRDVAWLRRRSLGLIVVSPTGRTRTVVVWAVGEDYLDRVERALGFRVIEPSSNVREVP